MKNARRFIPTLLKSAFSIGVATVLLHLTVRKSGLVSGQEAAGISLTALVQDFQAVLRLLSHADPRWLGLATLLYFGILLLVNWRWQSLLRGIGLHLPYHRVFQMGLVGLFFNIALPGSVSGDVVKIAYVIREAPHQRTSAALSVLLDRILGLCGLLTLSAVTLLLSLPFLLQAQDPYVRLAVGVILLGIVGMAVGWTLLFNVHRLRAYADHHPGLRRLRQRLPQVVRTAANKVVQALDLYRQAPRQLLLGLAKSIAVHLLLATIILSLVRSLGYNLPGWLGCALCAQVGEIAGMIPLAPAGIGLRDYVNATLLHSLGASRDCAGASLLFTCILTSWSLAGAACFILFRRREKQG